jgi:hypothetical protein
MNDDLFITKTTQALYRYSIATMLSRLRRSDARPCCGASGGLRQLIAASHSDAATSNQHPIPLSEYDYTEVWLPCLRQICREWLAISWLGSLFEQWRISALGRPALASTGLNAQPIKLLLDAVTRCKSKQPRTTLTRS